MPERPFKLKLLSAKYQRQVVSCLYDGSNKLKLEIFIFFKKYISHY